MLLKSVWPELNPALCYRAIEQIYGAALAAKGVAASLTAGHDAKHGTVVQIALQHPAQKALAEEALARYTVRYTFA